MHISKIIKQKNNENIIMMLRRHPFVLVPSFIIFLLTHAIAIGGYFFITTSYAHSFATNPGRALTIMLTAILLLSAWLQMYGQFMDYYLDMWIVTNSRIINVEQHGLFGRTISETDLYKVQDVTSKIDGFFPTTLNYGFVYIQSAGEIVRFAFEEIPAPHLVRKIIIQNVQKDRKKHAVEAMVSEV